MMRDGAGEVTTMAKLWIPTDLMDEYTPPGRATPEAWLVPEHPGIRDYDQHVIAERYGPGDKIRFCWVEQHASAILFINTDGTLARPPRCPETPDMFTGEFSPEIKSPAAEANAFYNDDFSVFGQSPDEFARLFAVEAADEFSFSGDPLQVDVQVSTQSDIITFIINADGKSLTLFEAKEAT